MLPPKVAALLLTCIPAHLRDPVAGDADEQYPKMLERYGLRGANFWYWTQVIGAVCRLGIVERLWELLKLFTTIAHH